MNARLLPLKTTNFARLALLVALMAALASFIPPFTPRVQAADCLVTDLADSGSNTLRAMLADSACSYITFAGDLSIVLASQLTIDRNVTISGVGQIITLDGDTDSDGTGETRAFYITSDAAVTLDQLNIIHGNAGSDNGGGIANYGVLFVTDSALSDSTATSGGGIANYGLLTVDNSTLSDNTASANGGSIFNDNSSLTVSNSTFSGNSAEMGGGIYNVGSGLVTISDSAFSSNTALDGGGIYNEEGTLNVNDSGFASNNADRFGGGICNHSATIGGATLNMTNCTFSDNSTVTLGGGIANYGTLNVTNSTFVGNSATDPTGSGGGIADYGALNVTNSTFADNSAVSSGGGIMETAENTTLRNTILVNSLAGGNCAGTITDNGNNIEDGATCGFISANGSISNTNPLLAALGDYGGSTQTLALLPGSPAIDVGDDLTCDALGAQDQRGVTRPQGAHCDAGAYESVGFTLTLTSGNNQSAPINTVFTDSLKVSVTSTVTPAEPVDGGKITFTAPDSGASAGITGNPATIASGSASVNATANSVAGAYSVTASAAGTNVVTFTLTNTGMDGLPVAPQISNNRQGADVVVSWADNATNAGGYIVWYHTQPDFQPGDAGAVNVPLPAGTTSYTHTHAAGGGSTYFYLVQGVNAVGVRSAASNRVGMFGFTLVPGAP